MATGVSSWSQTAANNATADATINWQEGQAPSSVNDSARSMMASVAKYRDDISGALLTSGTSTAYTLTSNQGFVSASAMHGQIVAFTPHATNGIAPTLSVDGLGAANLRGNSGQNLSAGVLIAGTPYVALYNNFNGEFIVHGVTGNPFGIPIGGGMLFFGLTAPNSNFAFPLGQAISRITFSTLFSLVGTAYGAGDGSSTFNLPDLTGRTPVGRDPGGARITGNTFTSTDLGGSGGAETIQLHANNIPPYTPSGNVSVSNVAVAYNVRNYATSGNSDITALSLGSNVGTSAGTLSSVSGSATGGFTGFSSGFGNAGTGQADAHANVQPSLVCNFIMRII